VALASQYNAAVIAITSRAAWPKPPSINWKSPEIYDIAINGSAATESMVSTP